MSNQPKLSSNQIKPDGLRAREYAKFRKPRYDEVVVATDNEGSAFYPASVNATAKDETTVIAAPGADKCIRVKTLMANNVGADQLVVSLQEGTTGDEKFKNSMPQYGSMWNMNFIGAYWILAPNTTLEVNLSAIGNVNVQVGYDIVKAIPTKAL
ncbi:hypothetical protein HQ584_13310, partial [Patescibacteria group bacterium]|nr:hypothetical protein [Patescibacteria group bacterium]